MVLLINKLIYFIQKNNYFDKIIFYLINNFIYLK